MRLKTNKRGQSTLEYAIIVVVVVGALIAMQWYIKGGYQGKLRQASDDMGRQFSPTNTATNESTTITSTNTENWGGGSYGGAGGTDTVSSNAVNLNVTQTVAGSENVSGLTPTGDQR
ncbi:MAG: hypothetical protein A3K83_07280 [Omnitrophica WOR_2 bacterium RBG_13_44_8b]|nr:MAG: hypothetical protein A3K83_07280 [Omnitrophica WOR_2 bacterium RBG_13_44_8b]